MTTVNLCAPGNLDPVDSYGLIACRLIRHLSELGVHVNAHAFGELSPPTQPEDIAALVKRPIRPALGGIMLGYPTNYHRHANPLVPQGPRVAVTMFESSRIPPAWVEPLNACDAVIVPSTFCAEVFRDCGVTVPVHVIPLGVGEAFTPRTRDPGRPFTCLAFLDRGRRKGGLVALSAFHRAFGDDPAYRLVLKARAGQHVAPPSNPNVAVLEADLTDGQLADLYGQCDVLINPHRGEGFGLIPREAAACGCIALTTDWSGTADDLDEWGLPLPYRLVPADWGDNRTLKGLDLGLWAEPDPDGVAAILRRVAEERDSYRAFAQRAAAAVRRLYDWRAFAQGVLDVWKEVAWQPQSSAAAYAPT